MKGEIFNDASMLEIFRAEVETHVESLTSGLLALERDPGDTSHLAEMMRGAHSIKGAARIVGIDPAVRVAHVMEDGFVAAQHGKITLRPEHVDVLLRGVDMLNRIANGSNDPSIAWAKFDDELTPLVAEMMAVLAGTSTSPVAKETPSAQPERKSAEPISQPTIHEEPPVRSALEVSLPVPAMLDAAAAEKVRRAFVAALDANAALIRLDLSNTNDLDAIGVALLVAIAEQSHHEGQRVELVGPTAELRPVLEALGIMQLYSAGGR